MVPLPLIAGAFAAYHAARGIRVDPSIPILYFGDLTAYENSPKRIVTVALNPSNVEFPSPSTRFPMAARWDRFPGGSCLPAYL